MVLLLSRHLLRNHKSLGNYLIIHFTLQTRLHLHFLKFHFSSSKLNICLWKSKCVPNMSWGRTNPANTLLNGAIRHFTWLQVDFLGARIDISSISKWCFLKWWIIFEKQGFTSDPPLEKIINTELTWPCLLYFVSVVRYDKIHDHEKMQCWNHPWHYE